MKHAYTPNMAHVLQLPRSARARDAYAALRQSGFRGAYAAYVVGMLEAARSNMHCWIIIQRACLFAPESGAKWLKARGYE